MDKRSFLGFLLIALVIIFLPKYYEWVDPNYGNTDTLTTQAVPEEPSAQISESQPTTTIVEKNEETQEAIINEIEEQIYVIETDKFRAELSNKAGGSLKSFKLKEHHIITEKDTSLVELINYHQGTNLFLEFFNINSGTPQKLLNNFQLINQDKNIFTLHGNNTLELIFQYRYQGKEITRKFTFFGDQYFFNLTNDLSKAGDLIASSTYFLNWKGGISYTESDINEENRYAMAFAHTSPDETEKFKLKNTENAATEFDGATLWTAIRNKYFTITMAPEKPAEGYEHSGYGINKKQPTGNKEILHKYFGMKVELPKHSATTTKIYIGPLSKHLLAQVDDKLDNIMSFGAAIIRPISKAVLWLFTNMYKVIPNYGFVLIIFSILIKILLHPLTVKSNQSMKEMHKLQPLINELKEKYSDDPQKMNQATMKLYSEHGVNPMGGCLPLLFQMPILFALFTVFRSTIELRHAPFILWITDLSSPDQLFKLPFSIPFYGEYFNLLPLLMVAAQIFMQKMSGQTQTAQQKQMAYIMPIMFFFLFNNFPSGLVLYYTLFNILTIVQQQYFTPEPKPKAKKIKQRKSRLERMRELQQRRKNFK
jgi:YidC/Oxa1 family membrane protein insertase